MTAALFQRTADVPWIAVVPAIGLLLYGLDHLRRARVRRMIGPRAVELAAERVPGRRAAGRFVFTLALALAAAAALGPRFGGEATAHGWRGADIVVCLDVSRSMLARDVAPSRLDHAKDELRAFASHAGGDQLALVVFAGEARLAVPLTKDTRTFSALVGLADPTDVRVGGTNLGLALDAARAALHQSASAGSAIVLVTDGEDLGGAGQAAAARCRDEGITVFTVGLGSSLGSKITVPGDEGSTFLTDGAGNDVVSRMDPEALARIAETTGGTFLDAGAEEDALVALRDREIASRAKAGPAAADGRSETSRYQGILLVAFLLWILALALGAWRRT